MAKPGPSKTPTSILYRRGSWLVNNRKDEPKVETAAPECPDWITDEAKHAWNELMPQLEAMGVVARVDRNALMRYCTYFSRWKLAEQFIAKHGSVYPLKDDAGNIKCMMQFPQVTIAKHLGQLLIRLEQEFGMTASARSSLNSNIPRVDPDDGKARFFKSQS